MNDFEKVEYAIRMAREDLNHTGSNRVDTFIDRLLKHMLRISSLELDPNRLQEYRNRQS